MIDVSELMTDPDFVKTFTVKRPTISIAADGSESTTYREFDAVGIVQPAQPADIKSFPEGTRVEDLISVWSNETLSGSDGKRTESDVIVVDGVPYRVIREEQRADNGYSRVFATGFIP